MAVQKLSIEEVAEAARACGFDPDAANWDRRMSPHNAPASSVTTAVLAELVRRMPDNPPSRALVRGRLLGLQFTAALRR